MKPIISFALLAAIATIGAASAAATDPVGYITATIAGNAANNPAGAATYISPTLVQPTVFAGATTVTPSGGSVATFASGVPTTLDSTYVLEITSGTQEGWWSAVSASTATTVTIADPFPAGLGANTTISVRKFDTVKSFLGANSPGLNPFDGGATQADEVQILDPTTGGVTVIVYMPEALTGQPDQWLDFGLGANADNYPILPGTAIRVVRFDDDGTDFTVAGSVKVTATQADLFNAENWVSQPLAVGGSLDFMNFYNQLIKFDGGATLNDYLDVLNPDQSTTTYVALDESIGGGFMLDFGAGTNADAVTLAEGTGYVIRRDPTQPAGTIVIPAQEIVE